MEIIMKKINKAKAMFVKKAGQCSKD